MSRDESCPVGIWRPLTLTDADRALMKVRADATNGLRYGWPNVGLHLLDALASKVLGRRIRFARRFCSTKWEECSGNVADVWGAAGLTFGIETGTAAPGDVDDFCRSRPDHYVLLRALEPIPRLSPCRSPPRPVWQTPQRAASCSDGAVSARTATARS